MSALVDNLPMELDSYREDCERLARLWAPKGAFTVLKSLAGLSGAAVLAVLFPQGDSTSREVVGAGRYVLKLVRGASAADERESHARAREVHPDFAASHVAELVRTTSAARPGGGTVTALLYRFVGGGEDQIVRLDECKNLQMQRAVERVLGVLPASWCRGETTAQPWTARQILSAWLPRRLDDTRMDELRKLATETFNGQWLSPGSHLVDPVWLLEQSQFMDDTGAAIHCLLGMNHGDLHPGNILTNYRNPHETPFWIIDFANSSFDVPYGFDHGYLEAALLIHHVRGGVNPLLSVLQAQDGDEWVSNENQWLVGLLRSIARIERDWSRAVLQDMEDSIQRQFTLARIAAGLNWATKSWSSPEEQRSSRRAALYYASWWAGEYLKRHFPSSFDGLLGGGRPVRSQVVAAEARGAATAAEPAQPKEREHREAWDLVWSDVSNAARRFEGVNQRLVLVLDGGRPGEEAGALGRLPWSAVIDLDPGSDLDGVYQLAHRTLEQHRGLHICGLDLEIPDFRRGAVWMMAGGWPRNSEEPPDYDTWRYDYRPRIQDLVARLREATSLEPVTVVLLTTAASQDDDTHRRVEQIVDLFDLVYRGDSSTIQVLQVGVGPQIRHKLVQHFPLPPEELVRRLSEVYGLAELSERPRVPAGEGRWAELPLHSLRLLQEDLEVLHSDILQETRTCEDGGDETPFWKGHPPTWHDLNQHQDVPRRQQGTVLRALIAALGEGHNCRVELRHTPGAGGTTLARRVAWELRTSHPVALLRDYQGLRTVEHVDRLFRLARNRQVLLLVESSEIEREQLDQLMRELSKRSCRVVVLYVRRVLLDRETLAEDAASGAGPGEPSSTSGAASIIRLGWHMSRDEAEEFRQAYVQILERATDDHRRLDRIAELDKITRDRSMARYRVPFFYGLAAFEREFRPIRDYVRAHFESDRPVDPLIRQTMNFLALATRFGNDGIPRPVVDRLLQLRPSAEGRLSDLLGNGPAGLAIESQQSVGLVHPIIAEEVLQYSLGTRAASDAWQAIVGKLSIQLIDLLHGCDLTEIPEVRALLRGLFIKRDLELQAVGDEVGVQPFAELVMIADQHDEEAPQKGRAILRRLTEVCDDDAHFHLHLGRYLEKRDQAYEEAVRCVDKALRLQPESHLHWHQRGYIYWRWIEALAREKHASVDRLLDAIQPHFLRATQDFERARKIGVDDDAGFTSNIRMIAQVADAIRRVSGLPTIWEAAAASRQVQRWCDEWLYEALRLLDEVKGLHTRDELEDNEHIRRCERAIDELYGDPARSDQLIVQAEIRRCGAANNSFANRHLAKVYLRSPRPQAEGQVPRLDVARLRRIKVLMEANLKSGPSRPDDFQLWLEAYRHLPEFDADEAIRRLTAWTRRDGADFQGSEGTAYYYLAVLHFLRWFNGHDESPKSYLRLLQLSKEHGRGNRFRSPEWLSRTDLLGTDQGEARFCSVSEYDLGTWDRERIPRFWSSTRALARVNGTIQQIEGMQKGYIRVQHQDVRAFFHPGKDFYQSEHKNREVNFFLSFRHDELVAWCVELGAVDEGNCVTPMQRRREALQWSRPSVPESQPLPPPDIEQLRGEHRRRERERAAGYLRDLLSARRLTGGLALADLDSVLPALMRRGRLWADLGLDDAAAFVNTLGDLRILQNDSGTPVVVEADAARERPQGERRRGLVVAVYEDHAIVSDPSAGDDSKFLVDEERWVDASSCSEDCWARLERGRVVEFRPTQGDKGEPRAVEVVLVADTAERPLAVSAEELGTITSVRHKPGSHTFGFVRTSAGRDAYFKLTWFPEDQRSNVAPGWQVRFTPKQSPDGKVIASDPNLVGPGGLAAAPELAAGEPDSARPAVTESAEAVAKSIVESMRQRSSPLPLDQLREHLVAEFGDEQVRSATGDDLARFVRKRCRLMVNFDREQSWVRPQREIGRVMWVDVDAPRPYGFLATESGTNAYFQLAWFAEPERAAVRARRTVSFTPRLVENDRKLTAKEPTLVAEPERRAPASDRAAAPTALSHELVDAVERCVLQWLDEHDGQGLLSALGIHLRKQFDQQQLLDAGVRRLRSFLESRELLELREEDGALWVGRATATGAPRAPSSAPAGQSAEPAPAGSPRAKVLNSQDVDSNQRRAVTPEDVHQFVLFLVRDEGGRCDLAKVGSRIRAEFDERQLEGVPIRPLGAFLQASPFLRVELAAAGGACWVMEEGATPSLPAESPRPATPLGASTETRRQVWDFVVSLVREAGGRCDLARVGHQIRSAFTPEQLQELPLRPLRPFIEACDLLRLEQVGATLWVAESDFKGSLAPSATTSPPEPSSPVIDEEFSRNFLELYKQLAIRVQQNKTRPENEGPNRRHAPSAEGIRQDLEMLVRLGAPLLTADPVEHHGAICLPRLLRAKFVLAKYYLKDAQTVEALQELADVVRYAEPTSDAGVKAAQGILQVVERAILSPEEQAEAQRIGRSVLPYLGPYRRQLEGLDSLERLITAQD